jgi:hypothetical protein
VRQHGLAHVPCKTGPQCSEEELGRRGKGDTSNGALTFHTHVIGSPCRGKQGLILRDTRMGRAVGGTGCRRSMRKAMDGRRRAAHTRAWACKHELQLQRAARRERTRVACSGRRARCKCEDDCALVVSGGRRHSVRGPRSSRAAAKLPYADSWGALRRSASDPQRYGFAVSSRPCCASRSYLLPPYPGLCLALSSSVPHPAPHIRFWSEAYSPGNIAASQAQVFPSLQCHTQGS